jgi:hypothetical protein
MRRYVRWWGLVLLVLVLDVVTIVFDLFGPALRWVTVSVLTGILVLIALGWLLERRQHREQERAARAALARADAALRAGGRSGPP